MKVRITRTMRNRLAGTQLFQEPDAYDRHGYGDPGRQLELKERSARTRKDGSVTLDLDAEESAVLLSYAETFAVSAQDDARWDKAALGEMNAAQALVRQLQKLGVR